MPLLHLIIYFWMSLFAADFLLYESLHNRTKNQKWFKLWDSHLRWLGLRCGWKMFSNPSRFNGRVEVLLHYSISRIDSKPYDQIVGENPKVNARIRKLRLNITKSKRARRLFAIYIIERFSCNKVVILEHRHPIQFTESGSPRESSGLTLTLLSYQRRD